MPTKLRRYTINAPKDLEAFIEMEATAEHIPAANVIVRHLYARYEEMQRQSELFSRTRLREAGRSGPPVFETPDQPAAQPSSKTHGLGGQGKS